MNLMHHRIGKLKKNSDFWEGNADVLLTCIKQTSTINADKCWNSNTKNVIRIALHCKVRKINVKRD